MIRIPSKHYLSAALIFIAVIAMTIGRWRANQDQTVLAGQKVCDEVNIEMVKTGGRIEPPLTLADCIEANKDCERRWGKRYVWAGASDADNVPICEQTD